MTQFINCYGNIQAEITRLHITNTNSLVMEQHEKLFSSEQLANLKAKILTSLNKTYLSHYTEQENIDKGIIQINGIYDKQFKFGYQIFFKIKFYYHVHQIVIFGTILKNSLPFRVLNKNHRLTINKLILKVNQSYKIGSLRLNPLNGQFSACHNSVFSSTQFDHLFQHKKLTQYLQSQFKKMEYFLNFFFFIILQIINQIPQNYSRSPELQNSKIRVLNNSFRKIPATMHLEYPFMFSDNANYSGSKVVQAKQMLQRARAISTVKRLSKPVYKDIANVIRMLSDKKIMVVSEDSFSEKQKTDFASKLMQPVFKSMQGQNLNVYSQIQIKEVIGKWQKIDQGGFGAIYKGTVAFSFKKNLTAQQNKMIKEKNYIVKQLVKKQDFDPSSKKLNHEKSILSKLKNYSSIFIAKYYYSQQPQYKNYLFIEYCKQKSLSILKNIHFQFMNLQSKLILLKNVAQGIKFLKDRQICHLDIKPTNVLIGFGGAKLIDFGQSYQSGINTNYRPGTSIPYAPPQSFSPVPQISFTSKMDVFSFGVLMYQLIYDCYPFDYSRNKYDMFKKMYGTKEYVNLIWLAPQRTQRQGFCRIHNILKFVSLKCLQREQKNRPCIQWIIIILHYCILLQSSLYR